MKNGLILAVLLAACAGGADSDTDIELDSDTSADSDTSTDTEADTECLDDVQPEYDSDGCLTFTGAGEVCGDAQGEVCTFLVGCGLSSDADQCSIDCTMATTLGCIDETTVDCLIAATCASDCDAAEACEYPVFQDR